ncbi:MAG: acetylglutamate kinase [Candidatus Melainabacteria bacterium]|nr:acetylglutamate kinase [Candidatus Melainabacteria bacterium]
MCINNQQTTTLTKSQAQKIKTFKAGSKVSNVNFEGALTNELIVIKIGGSMLKSEEAMVSLLTEVAILAETGAKLVLVHGGGPAISEALNAAGDQPHFVEGLRVTDDKVLGIAQTVLDGLNGQLVEHLNNLGINATSVNSKTEDVLTATKKFIHCSSGASLDIGYVGEITSVNDIALKELVENSLPVVASLAVDASGQLYNINADNVAMAIAVALGADKLVYITDVPGIMMDKNVIPKVIVDEVSVLIESGIISGGMIPKVRSCVSGIKKGIGSILIGSADNNGDLLAAIMKPGSSGTLIVDETPVAA